MTFCANTISEGVTAIRAVVNGRVQGVGFRDYVENRARFLRLAGLVRNMPDGRAVEVIAEGPRESLEKLIEHLREGPRMSRVDGVEVEWREATGEYRDFGTAY
jgi:acylphosphatase